MEYLDLCRLREVGYTSTKLHFANSSVRKPLKYTPLLVHVRDAFRNRTHGIRSSSAGYQTSLHYCGRPLLDWGGGCLYSWLFGTNTCTVPPLIYIYIYIYEWMMHLYSPLLCIAVNPKCFTIMWWWWGGVSPQPPPVCSIHLNDATAATGQWLQCAHHTPATGGEERES